mgnify:CR=1 FL=1
MNLEIKRTFRNYFKFWLGRIHAVNIENVPDYDNAMSMEGKLSRNMAVTYINTRKKGMVMNHSFYNMPIYLSFAFSFSIAPSCL